MSPHESKYPSARASKQCIIARPAQTQETTCESGSTITPYAHPLSSYRIETAELFVSAAPMRPEVFIRRKKENEKKTKVV